MACRKTLTLSATHPPKSVVPDKRVRSKRPRTQGLQRVGSGIAVSDWRIVVAWAASLLHQGRLQAGSLHNSLVSYGRSQFTIIHVCTRLPLHERCVSHAACRLFAHDQPAVNLVSLASLLMRRLCLLAGQRSSLPGQSSSLRWRRCSRRCFRSACPPA